MSIFSTFFDRFPVYVDHLDRCVTQCGNRRFHGPESHCPPLCRSVAIECAPCQRTKQGCTVSRQNRHRDCPRSSAAADRRDRREARDSAESLIPYGHDKAKIGADFIRRRASGATASWCWSPRSRRRRPARARRRPRSGSATGCNRIGKQAAICLREPSLGPCFGMKGGAAGGGYAQVVPMDGHQPALHRRLPRHRRANNLLAAMIDNHIHWGNQLNIDPRRVTWRRVVDMNDRALRPIVVRPRRLPPTAWPARAGFDITVASEIMAIFCLATDLEDLREAAGQHRGRLHRENEAGHGRRAQRRRAP